MKQRRFGTDGPSVSAIGLGCSGMSSDYGRPDDARGWTRQRFEVDLSRNVVPFLPQRIGTRRAL